MLTFNDILEIELKKNRTTSAPQILKKLDELFTNSSKRIKLIRHNLNDSACRECYNKKQEGQEKWWDIYQQTQYKAKKPFENTEYIFSFVSDGGKTARYIGCWHVLGRCNKAELGEEPKDFTYKNFFDEKHIFYKLEKINNFFNDYEDRLVIDWGKAARAWHQRVQPQNVKEVISISPPKDFVFEGYEKVVLTFNKLKKICTDKYGDYKDWKDHLSSINAVYLIVDTKTGAQYVGSAYGKEGLWGRWSHYVSSENGHLDDNKGIKKYLDEKDKNGNLIHSVKDFQFSIMHITSKNIGENDALDLEKLYKKKLCSRSEHGLNEN